jgi:hypothetical protein
MRPRDTAAVYAFAANPEKEHDPLFGDEQPLSYVELRSRKEEVMQVRNSLLLVFLRLACRRVVFTDELNAGPECGILVSPMLVESGSEIGPALSVRYVPAVGIVSR